MNFLMWSRLVTQLPIFGYIINCTLLFFVLLTIIFHQKTTEDGLRFFLEYIGFNLYPYLRYLIELYLHISAYFAIESSLLAIILFVSACILALFMTALLQNFTKRKDEFCCKSI